MFLVFLLTLTCSLWQIDAQAAFFYKSNPCEKAISLMEAKYQLPHGLMYAIAIVESGRKSTNKPWPWSVGTKGRSHYPSSKEVAIALTRKMQSRGTKNIDVGCMQINLKAHPKAFTCLSDAFNPHKNVEYAAKFIKSLKTKKNTWNDVIGLYHSSKKKYHIPYKKRVNLAWLSHLTKNKHSKKRKKCYCAKKMFAGSTKLPESIKIMK